MYLDREDASSMVTAGATANTTEGNSRASRESGLLCSHSHGESMYLHDELPDAGERVEMYVYEYICIDMHIYSVLGFPPDLCGRGFTRGI